MWRRLLASLAASAVVAGAVAVALVLDRDVAHPVGVLRILACGAGGISLVAETFFTSGVPSRYRPAEVMSFSRIFLFLFAGPRDTGVPFDAATISVALLLDVAIVAMGIGAGFLAVKNMSGEDRAAARTGYDRSTLMWAPVAALLLLGPTAWARDWTAASISIGIGVVVLIAVMIVRRLRRRGLPAAGLEV